jgi:hypothetical protein
LLGKSRILNGIHKAKALPPLRNGNFEVPTLEEFPSSSIKVIPKTPNSISIE